MRWFRTIYPNLRGAAAVRGDGIKDLAKVIDVSVPAMRRRLKGAKNGGTDFSAYECWCLCQHFGMSFEELFKTRGDDV